MQTTVGRKVWFYMNRDQEQPWDGTVIKADEGDGTSSIYVIDPRGSVSVHHDVPQVGGDHDYPKWDWMPYQKEQAAKQEAGLPNTPPSVGTPLKQLGEQAKAEEAGSSGQVGSAAKKL